MTGLEGGSDAFNVGKRKAEFCIDSEKGLLSNKGLSNKKIRYGPDYLQSSGIVDVEVTSVEVLTTPNLIGSAIVRHADPTQ